MVLAFCAGMSAVLFAGSVRPDEKGPANKPPKVGEKAAEALIRQLRSPNKDPNPKMGFLIDLPKDYDQKAQKKVEEAEDKLIELGVDVFPFLIDHLNDKEYSKSIPTSIMRSLSVGNVCFLIIENQVDLFASRRVKSRLGSDGKPHGFRSYFSQYCDQHWYTQNGVRKWWNEHKACSLREMQIKALLWDIEDERSIGFPTKKAEENILRPLLEQLAELKK
jgi:hypothetical protein